MQNASNSNILYTHATICYYRPQQSAGGGVERAQWCNALQCTATHYNTLQHTAMQFVITVRNSPQEEASSERSDVNWSEFSKSQLATSFSALLNCTSDFWGNLPLKRFSNISSTSILMEQRTDFWEYVPSKKPSKKLPNITSITLARCIIVALFIEWSNTLQHTAMHCNTLQHPATHYNALHYTATNCCFVHWMEQRTDFRETLWGGYD